MPRQRSGHRESCSSPGARVVQPDPVGKQSTGRSHSGPDRAESHPLRHVPASPERSRLLSGALCWGAVTLVVTAVLAIHDRPTIAALAALGAVVIGGLAELVRS